MQTHTLPPSLSRRASPESGLLEVQTLQACGRPGTSVGHRPVESLKHEARHSPGPPHQNFESPSQYQPRPSSVLLLGAGLASSILSVQSAMLVLSPSQPPHTHCFLKNPSNKSETHLATVIGSKFRTSETCFKLANVQTLGQPLSSRHTARSDSKPLNLPMPKQIDHALPLNLVDGVAAASKASSSLLALPPLQTAVPRNSALVRVAFAVSSARPAQQKTLSLNQARRVSTRPRAPFHRARAPAW
eukprot:3868372-Rhodomonas_salina.1